MKSINIELSILENNIFVCPFLPIFLNQTIINRYAINITASIDIETIERISITSPDHTDRIGKAFVIPRITKDIAGIKIIKKEMFLKKSIFSISCSVLFERINSLKDLTKVNENAVYREPSTNTTN
jgi:hypothetical protein